MSNERYKLYSINNNPDSDFDVIFVHGLNGDKYSTWENDNGQSWLNWLAEDYNISVWTIGYGANRTNWIEYYMSLEDTARYFLETLKSHRIGKKPYVFIVHSLGGLLIKNILIKANLEKNYQQIINNCHAVVFFAVPHTGSGWAILLNYAKLVLRNSNLLKVLSKGNSYLNSLVIDFNGLVKQKEIETFVFYETKELRAPEILGWLHLKKGSKIVSQDSATHIYTKNPIIGLPEDHLSICKIKSRTSDLYCNKINTIMNKVIKTVKERKQLQQEDNQKNPAKNISNSNVTQMTKTIIDKDVTIKVNNLGIIITGDNSTVK